MGSLRVKIVFLKMKKLKFNLAALLCLCALLTATTFTSCNKDDDDVSTNPNDLIGKWKLVEVKDEWKDSDGEKGSETEKYDNDEEMWETWTFKEDGTLIEEWFYKFNDSKIHTDTSNYQTDKNKLSGDFLDDGYTAVFSISGNTLTITCECKEDGDWDKETYIFKKVNN